MDGKMKLKRWTISIILIAAFFFIGIPGIIAIDYHTQKDIYDNNFKSYSFQYQTEEGDIFDVTIGGTTSRGLDYYADIYIDDERIFREKISSYEKEDFHIFTVLNENGMVCYSLGYTPFGRLSDGTWVDFSMMFLDESSNPEIIYIGETLIQQDILYFDDFVEYLVKNGSEIAIERANRFQAEDFTETELQQISVHGLYTSRISRKAESALQEATLLKSGEVLHGVENDLDWDAGE
jgi:hypothetical protein